MAFVNEFVSDLDVKKYELENVKYKYSSSLIASGIPSSFKFDWVFDRERNIYLMKVRHGREEICNRTYWILNWDGCEFEIQIDLADGSSPNLNDSPFVIVFDLVEIIPKEKNLIHDDKVISVLKEALTVYGYEGARRQVENTLVNFNF